MTSEPEIGAETKPSSFVSNLTGVYFSPGETFKGFVDRVGLVAPAIGLKELGATTSRAARPKSFARSGQLSLPR